MQDALTKVARTPLLCVISLCGIVVAQQPQCKAKSQGETIRIRTELVQLRVVVTDRSGNPVANLTQDDFEVLEDDRSQEISFFAVERISADPGRSSAFPETADERPQSRGQSPSRSIVLFVDTLHLSTFSLLRVKRHLRQFIHEQMTAHDLVAVVTSSGTLGVLQQFMSDRRMLRYAVEKITPFHRPESLFTPYVASRVANQEPSATELAGEILRGEADFADPRIRAAEVLAAEAHLTRSTLHALNAVSERLADMPGQRLIVLFSDGFSLMDSGGMIDARDLRSVTGNASRSGVVIYSLDAKGLTTPLEHSAVTTGVLSPSGNLSRYVSESRIDQRDPLKALAYDTGGEAFFDRNDLRAPLERVLYNNRIYYSLAYYPVDSRDKKAFRNVTVRLKGHPEYVVRGQRGYLPFEVKPAERKLGPREKLLQALTNPLPLTAIPVTSSSDFLETAADDAQVVLRVHIDGNPFQYRRQGGGYLLDCEVVVSVYDWKGKVASSFSQSVRSNLTEKQVELAKQSGYRYSTRMTLKPGLYQVRTAVRETETELIGTSMSWVEVPDLRKGRLALSSVFLGRSKTEEDGLSTVSTSRRQPSSPRLLLGSAAFKPGETVFYRFVVYNADAKEQRGDDSAMKVEILRGEETLYEGPWQPLASRLIRNDRKGLECGGEIVLGLEPGVYELRITVKNNRSKREAQQAAYFEVEP